MVGVVKGLWLYNHIPSRKDEFGSRCTESKESGDVIYIDSSRRAAKGIWKIEGRVPLVEKIKELQDKCEEWERIERQIAEQEKWEVQGR